MTADRTKDLRHEGCYLLHSRPYRETSLLVRIFHREDGVIGAVAKGAATSRRLQPFYPFSARITGRGGLKSLFAAEEESSSWLFTPQASLAALYANELVLRCCAEQDGHPFLYDAYVQLLAQLAGQAHTTAREIALRRFEQMLFSDIGYQLNYQIDSSNHAIEPHSSYHLGSEWMFVQHPQGSYSGACLCALSADNYAAPQTLQTAKRLTRDVLQRILSKPLGSWKLFA